MPTENMNRQLTENECGEHDPEFVQDIFEITEHLAFTLDVAQILGDYYDGRTRKNRVMSPDMAAEEILEAHRKHNKAGADIHPAKIIELFKEYGELDDKHSRKAKQWITET